MLFAWFFQNVFRFIKYVCLFGLISTYAPFALARPLKKTAKSNKLNPAPAPAASPAQSLAVGVGVQQTESIYVGKKSTFSPIPLLDFRWEGFFTTGYTADYTWALGPVHFGPSVAYGSQPYKNRDSEMFEGLEEKRASLLGGVVFRTSVLTTNIELNMRTKALGNGGPSASLKFKKSVIFALDAPSHILVLSPIVTMTALSDKETQYQYGVKASEVEPALGRSFYEPKVGSIASPAFEMAYIFDQNLVFVLSYTHNFYSDAIVNSPLVSKRSSRSLFGGITYKL